MRLRLGVRGRLRVVRRLDRPWLGFGLAFFHRLDVSVYRLDGDFFRNDLENGGDLLVRKGKLK